MEFTITTNHETALQVKKCFESKGLNLTKEKGLALKQIDVDNRFVNLHFESSQKTQLKDLFFLGMHAEATKLEVKFDSFGNLPIEEAKELLKLTA